jgi:hypothetical protein
MIPCFQEYLHAHIHEKRWEYDYYLMKVSKVPFQLERVENDDWGNTFPVGTNVAGVIIITEGNKIHLNMNLFEEG